MTSRKPKHYHFIGVGGIGMSGIARILLHGGSKVSGSDVKENRITRELKSLGAIISIGHREENLLGADAVVFSSAIQNDNPEVRGARAKGIPLLKRAQALAELMKGKDVIAVGGSHGKTTTTSLASFLLAKAGFSPTAVVGGVLRSLNTNACLGEGDFFIAEADESDGSFLYYQPKYSIITNIDREHLDFYNDFEGVKSAFKNFIGRTTKDGCVFCCGDDPHLVQMLGDYKGRRVTFGLNKNSDINAAGIRMEALTSEFDCFRRDKFIERFSLAMGGEHNISNALSVIALGLELGIDTRIIKKVLQDTKGARRRQEVKFRDSRFLLIDDYAHHPTEIKATLATVKNFSPQRLLVVFQPHRYSRTKFLIEEFSRSFDHADHLVLTDIYPAAENPLPGINKELLCGKIEAASSVKSVDCIAKEDLVQHVLKIAKEGDLIITLGAGDITKISDALAESLNGRE